MELISAGLYPAPVLSRQRDAFNCLCIADCDNHINCFNGAVLQIYRQWQIHDRCMDENCHFRNCVPGLCTDDKQHRTDGVLRSCVPALPIGLSVVVICDDSKDYDNESDGSESNEKKESIKEQEEEPEKDSEEKESET